MLGLKKMICNYRETIFTEKAASFLMEYLNYGHELDRQLLRLLDIKSGGVAAYLPENTNQDYLYRFEYGGVASREESIACAVTVIAQFLDDATRGICILEDASFRPSDPVMARRDTPWVALNDEVYYYIIGKYVDPLKIRRAIVEAESLHFFVCVLSSLPESMDFPVSDKTITAVDVEILAGRAEKFIVGAYDGEGYLIWHKGHNGIAT
jgi:hypothetical protein